jgi:hypothetical protein
MLTLMGYFSPTDRRALNGTVARWFLCVEHDSEQAQTVV